MNRGGLPIYRGRAVGGFCARGRGRGRGFSSGYNSACAADASELDVFHHLLQDYDLSLKLPSPPLLSLLIIGS